MVAFLAAFPKAYAALAEKAALHCCWRGTPLCVSDGQVLFVVSLDSFYYLTDILLGTMPGAFVLHLPPTRHT